MIFLGAPSCSSQAYWFCEYRHDIVRERYKLPTKSLHQFFIDGWRRTLAGNSSSCRRPWSPAPGKRLLKIVIFHTISKRRWWNSPRSRIALKEFPRLVGHAAIDYLQRWRPQRLATWLLHQCAVQFLRSWCVVLLCPPLRSQFRSYGPATSHDRCHRYYFYYIKKLKWIVQPAVILEWLWQQSKHGTLCDLPLFQQKLTATLSTAYIGTRYDQQLSNSGLREDNSKKNATFLESLLWT